MSRTPPKRRASHLDIPHDDALLSASKAAAVLGISPKNFAAYARRWQVLLEGARVVRVRAGSRGRMKWLRSHVLRHLHDELLHPDRDLGMEDEDTTPPDGTSRES